MPHDATRQTLADSMHAPQFLYSRFVQRISQRSRSDLLRPLRTHGMQRGPHAVRDVMTETITTVWRDQPPDPIAQRDTCNEAQHNVFDVLERIRAATFVILIA